VAAVDGQLNDCLRQNPRGINCECANIQECNRAPPCIKTRASRNHSAPSRPYDLHSAQIKKSDDLDNACAKSRVLEALLAQAVAMQIISTLGVRRRQ
jgi:hypothetical protein